MSSRTCYDKYICFKLSLIILIIGLNSQLNRHVILNCTKGLYSIKTRRNALSNGCPASPSSQLWACAVSDASRSRQLWTGEHHHQAKAPGKSKIKRVLAYYDDKLPSHHWRQSHQSHSDTVEITLRKLDGTSCQRSAASRINGACSGDDTPTVTSRQ